ncbi:hypothetical protein [Luteimonas sp. MC1750]|uniref:hypothetical protein n=1 Tax=Luteimonas sp. MC1750 TaxID=2799326 RepID=UPI0018F0A2A1|nr:hypothetical protein [Luteimonas sp. MC1750]MBJ6983976.1 hypothetical protein [Luteimonas sp. MC1750]QQO06789.1 hypothetical protein JGR68_05020 [Luteimonas sp. MC1750]
MKETESVPWQEMSILRLLSTLGCAAAAFAVLGVITGTAFHGWEFLLLPLIAWFAFGMVMGLGAFATLTSYYVLELLLFWMEEATRHAVYKFLRWAVLLVGLGYMLFIGVLAIVDGVQNNRFVPAEVHFKQCMTPQTKTVRESYKTCADGWASSSIGRSGACSHHGGVVERWVERKKTYQPHSEAYCRKNSLERSWID